MRTPLYAMPLAVGNLTDKSEKNKDSEPLWTDRDPVQERFLQEKMKRIRVLKDHAKKFYPGIRESIMIYEGKVSIEPEKADKRDSNAVMPIAKSFAEAKTAEELKAMNEYEYTPVKDTKDSWKVELLKDVNDHVDRRTKKKSKKHRMVRNKNIHGVSIKRKGYRKQMRWIKERVESDDDARATEYRMRYVPVYDDLFEEIVSPFEFAIDPNKSMDDAMDCVHTHIENPEVFKEIYGNDPRFINVDKVKPGVKFRFNDSGEYVMDELVKNEGIAVEEYFNKVLHEWVVVANGVLLTPVEEKYVDKDGQFVGENEGKKMFIATPLEDDHGELPFVSFHNSPTFAIEVFSPPPIISPDGESVSSVNVLNNEEVFWTKGDPLAMKEIIELDTGFTRAMFRNLKIASEVIVATDKGYKFKNKGWKTGDQAVGMKGKFEVVRVAESTAGDIRGLLDYLFLMKVLLIGIDPRNLSSENKTRTATEAAILRETAMVRLEENIEYNEENGELRDGTLTFKLIQQYYSKPETVRITGLESEEELKRFDVIEKDEDGKVFAGQRFRLIKSSLKLNERRKQKKNGEYKYYLTKSETGISSFLARPEYIRASEVDIAVSTRRRAGEIRSINVQQSMELIRLFMELFALAQPGQNGEPPLIDKADLPDMKEELRILKKAMGRPETANEEPDEKDVQQEQVMNEYKAMKQPLSNTTVQNVTPQ